MLTKSEIKILMYLDKNGPSSTRKIQLGVYLSQKHTYRLLSNLRKLDFVKVVDKNRRPFIWDLKLGSE